MDTSWWLRDGCWSVLERQTSNKRASVGACVGYAVTGGFARRLDKAVATHLGMN